MAASAATTGELRMTADETLTWYSAQPGVEYGFCNRCGSSLFWRADDKPDSVSICAGTLDSTVGLTTAGVLFDAEIADYILERPDVETHALDRSPSSP